MHAHRSQYRFGASETPAKLGVAPELGADNDGVLEWIGYSAAEIASLKERKTV
jgi:crotonobetainyl-CoA:carnitine CoA-transferase CaiB-like acyl-CoA transferase